MAIWQFDLAYLPYGTSFPTRGAIGVILAPLISRPARHCRPLTGIRYQARVDFFRRFWALSGTAASAA